MNFCILHKFPWYKNSARNDKWNARLNAVVGDFMVESTRAAEKSGRQKESEVSFMPTQDPFLVWPSSFTTPKDIVDVGVHLGGWTRSALNVFPLSKYTLFELLKILLESRDNLGKPNISREY